MNIILQSIIAYTILSTINGIDINTSYGTLRGSSEIVNQQIVNVFKGVPLAEAPVGELRFQLPQPPKHWEGVRDATKYSAACMSNSTQSKSRQAVISEDCLYLNVWTSDKCMTSHCPVLVYLHGGVLNYDSAVMYNSTFIAERYAARDVVFVLPAMRLGVFGLLTLEDDALVPRNLAIYDIIAGLSWVNREIPSFGGDPKDVTLMGHSMGGGVAVLMAFSKQIDPSARLFQRVISLSGDLLFMQQEHMISLTRDLVEKAGCSSSPLSCLRSLPATSLLTLQRYFEDEDGRTFKGVLFAPPIAQFNQSPADFISDPPMRDFLGGSTSMEFGSTNDAVSVDVGTFMGLDHSDVLAAKFERDREEAARAGTPMLSYLSQNVFVTNYLYGKKLKEKGANVYVYQFTQPPRPLHSIDLPYIIGHHIRKMNENDRSIDGFYSEMFVNFTKYGSPSPNWSQFEPEKANYYCIEVDIENRISPSMKLNYNKDTVDYWLRNMTLLDDIISKEQSLRALNTLDSYTAGTSIWTYVILIAIFIIGMAMIITVVMTKPPRSGTEGRPLLA